MAISARSSVPCQYLDLLPSWLSSICIALVVLSAFGADARAAPSRDVIQIRQAEFIISDAVARPGNDAAWQTVALPDRSPKPNGGALTGYWYRAAFTLAAAQRPLYLYFSQLPSGGTVFVNGMLVGAIPSADTATQVRWHLPHLLFLPAPSLREGQNDIAVRFAIREPLTSFGQLEIGPEKPIRKDYERALFWQDTTAQASTTICLLAAALIIAFWIRRPQEKLYGFFGICVLFWGLRTLFLRMSVVPMDLLLLWRFCYYFTTSGFIVSITLFLLKFCGHAKPRFTKALTAYWLAGCTAFVLIGMPVRPLLDSYWLPGFLPFTLYAITLLTIFSLRRRTLSSLAMMLAIILALGLSLHDITVQEGWLHLPEIYLMHLGIPLFLLVMASVLLGRFIDSLRQVELLNAELEQRVQQRTAQLGRINLALQNEIVERKRVEEMLSQQATTDELTGLANRRHFGTLFAAELERASRYRTSLSLIMFDIDHFKDVNDHYGHLAADAVLLELARRVSTEIRRGDIFARWGGEEFLILVIGSTLEGAAAIAEKIRIAIERHRFRHGSHITASFGVTECMAHDRTVNATYFIDQADQLMYRAKSNGRNRVETGTPRVGTPAPENALR